MSTMIRVPLGGSNTNRFEPPSDNICLINALDWFGSYDKPVCHSPVLATFWNVWNTGMRSNDERRQLAPLLARLAGTAASDQTELARSDLAVDWMMKVAAATWLDAADAELHDHAENLRAGTGVTAAGQTIRDVAKGSWSRSAENVGEEALFASGFEAAYQAGLVGAWFRFRQQASTEDNNDSWYVANAEYHSSKNFVVSIAEDAALAAAWTALNPHVPHWRIPLIQRVTQRTAKTVLEPVVEKLQASARELFDEMIAA